MRLLFLHESLGRFKPNVRRLLTPALACPEKSSNPELSRLAALCLSHRPSCPPAWTSGIWYAQSNPACPPVRTVAKPVRCTSAEVLHPCALAAHLPVHQGGASGRTGVVSGQTAPICLRDTWYLGAWHVRRRAGLSCCRTSTYKTCACAAQVDI